MIYLTKQKLNKDCLINIKDFLYYSKLELEWFKFLHSQKLELVNREISFIEMEYKTSCYIDDNNKIKFYKKIMSLPTYFFFMLNYENFDLSEYNIILRLELKKYFNKCFTLF